MSKTIYSFKCTKRYILTGGLSAGMHDGDVEGLRVGALQHVDIGAVPLVGPDEGVGPPVCPVDVVLEERDGEWVR